jgi:hypothetical protein
LNIHVLHSFSSTILKPLVNYIHFSKNQNLLVTSKVTPSLTHHQILPPSQNNNNQKTNHLYHQNLLPLFVLNAKATIGSVTVLSLKNIDHLTPFTYVHTHSSSNSLYVYLNNSLQSLNPLSFNLSLSFSHNSIHFKHLFNTSNLSLPSLQLPSHLTSMVSSSLLSILTSPGNHFTLLNHTNSHLKSSNSTLTS